jgi:FixJ family two-component response regulator
MPHKSDAVYVVDDDESIRRALKRLLRSFDYEAVTFASAEEFIASAPEGGKGCLLLDICLPGMTGLDLLEKLNATGAKYAVVFMTAHDDPQWRQRAKAAGAVAYLRKPFAEQALLDAIRTCLQEADGYKNHDKLPQTPSMSAPMRFDRSKRAERNEKGGEAKRS